MIDTDLTGSLLCSQAARVMIPQHQRCDPQQILDSRRNGHAESSCILREEVRTHLRIPAKLITRSGFKPIT
jgi:hypothetical protein